MRVFLTDSDDTARGALAGALRDGGYDVIESRDSREALGRIRTAVPGCCREAPAALVASAGLPCESGIDVLVRVRDADEPVPVILVVSCDDGETRTRALRLGADAVVDGPADAGKLIAALERVRSDEID